MEKVKVPSVYKFRIYPSGKAKQTFNAHKGWLFEYMKQACFFYNECLSTYNKYFDDRIDAWRELKKTEEGKKEITEFNAMQKEVRSFNAKCASVKDKKPVPIHPSNPYMDSMELYRVSGKFPGFELLPAGVKSQIIRKLMNVMQAYFAKTRKALEAGATPKRPRKDGRFDNWPHFSKLSDFTTLPIQLKAGIDFVRSFYDEEGRMIRSRVKIGVGDNIHYYRVNFDRPLPKWAAGKPVLQLIRNTTNTMWSIAIPLPENETEVRYSETGKEVGIDLGLKHFATTSDGEMFDLFTKKERADLLSTWSRKQTLMTNKPCHQIKDRKARSKSYWKAHAAYREYEDYLKRLRQDRMYCLANKLVEKYDVIYIGKMNLQDLMKKKKKKEIKTEKNRWLKAKHKRRMRRNFSWGSMYTFMQILKHVAFKNNKVVVEVDERYSTMLCSKCQAVVEKDLSIRTHSCPHCGLVLDRDHNAAKNMIFLGKMDTETRKDFNKDVQKKRAVQKEELSVQEMEDVVVKPIKKRSEKKVVVEAACEDIHTKVLSSGQFEFIL